MGRYFGIRWFVKGKYLTWNNAVVFGLGHGGIEAFALVGIPYAKALTDVIEGRNIVALLNTPPEYFLPDGIERIIVVLMHIGLTMLVFYAVRNRKALYLVYAVLAHMLVDFILPLLQKMGVSLSMWGKEGVLAVFAAFAVVIMIIYRKALMEPPENGGKVNEE